MPHTNVPIIYGSISQTPALQLDKENGLVLLLAGATTVAWDVAELGMFITQLERYRDALVPPCPAPEKVFQTYASKPEGWFVTEPITEPDA